MLEIRRQTTYEGYCTVFVGQQVVISGIDKAEAEALIAYLSWRTA